MLNKWTSLATFLVCLAGIYYCWNNADSQLERLQHGKIDVRCRYGVNAEW